MTSRELISALALGLLCTSAAADFTVTGVFEYEDKGWGYSGWTGVDPMRPIRRADVTVLDENTAQVLGTGSTGQDGSFSIVCTSVGTTDIQVRVNADTDLDGSFQRIRVTTEGNSEYSALSPVFNGHDTNVDLDVGTTSVLKITSGGDEANPFNMLDMGVDAFEYITQGDIAGVGNVQTVRIYWPSGSGSFASGAGAHMADDDGYDDAVILHELGHVVHNLYSDSDSPGGSHFFGDSDQDPRLSFGEGYATFFAGTVMIEAIERQAIYMDANGSSQTGGVGLRLRLETVAPYAGDSRGSADEVAVACVLFDILDDELSSDQSAGVDDDLLTSTTLIGGDNVHQAWWDVFVGPIDSAPSVSLNDAWDGWFSVHGSDGMLAEMQALYDLREVKFFNDVDEPNSFISDPTPWTSSTWSSTRTLYHSEDALPVPGNDDRDWYSIEAVIGSVVDFETRYPGNANDADTQADTEVSIWDPSDTKAAEATGGGTGRNGAIFGHVIDETGTWKFRVRTLNTTSRRYGKYDFRIRYDFENELPQITAGPTAVPSTITDDLTSMLSVTATDAQALSYAWTPLSGGSIVGSGSSVTFDPPTVGATTVFDVQVDVTDSLGAVTSAVVQITVDPAGALCGNAATVTSGGAGKPGTFGVPALVGNNLPVLPSSDFELQLTGGLPSTTTWVIIGLSRIDAPFDGGTMYPSPDILVPVATDPSGEVLLPLPLSSDPGACGLTLHWQFMVQGDPGAAGAKQTAQSNWVETVFGS